MSRALLLLALAPGCASSRALHPPPPAGIASPVADPPPSLVVVHTTLFAEGIQRQLDAALPAAGSGEAPLALGRTVAYRWERRPVSIGFDRGRLVVGSDITVTVLLLGQHPFQVRLTVAAEPVLAADYQARLQSITVEVHAESGIDRLSRAVEDTLQKELLARLEVFRLDLRPPIEAAHARLSRPLPLPTGDGGASACAVLRITAIQAGPTVLAGGLEKDLALTVLPSVVLPCPPPDPPGTPPPPLPLLANVATLASGPFAVTVPIAAGYPELGRAIEQAMGGRLFFSRDYPELYLEKPEVSAAGDAVVIKLSLGGSVRLGGRVRLSGEIYLSGHPAVVDNQLSIPDLDLTPGTAGALLKLKLLVDRQALRRQAQAALRVDLSQRIAAARGKLSTELSFEGSAAAPSTDAPGPMPAVGCLRAEALRAEVTSVHPHDTYLRIAVLVSAQAALYLPCRR